MAVSDGLGGSGSMQYEVGEEVVTGAYLASRAVMQSLEALTGQPDFWTSTDRSAALDAAARQAIEALVEKHGAQASRLKGGLVRKFPATLTVLSWQRQANGFLDVQVHNAGDSRAWLLHPVAGLQCLTRDDAAGYPDALQHLHDGAPMTQVICADHPWTLRHNALALEPDVLLICGSDGCFDYLRHPAEWEWMLLDTLMRSSSAEEWQKLLHDALTAIASDDVSLLLAAPDGAPMEALKQRFASRHIWLQNHVLPVLEQLPSLEQAAASVLKAELWATYRTEYEKLMPPIPAEEEKAPEPNVETKEASGNAVDIPIQDGDAVDPKEVKDE
jgi:serine/threonine protein phosphatase PrpC